MNSLPEYYTVFSVQFPNENQASAIVVPSDGDPVRALRRLGFQQHRPTIFISGGASNMSEDDLTLTERIIEGVAQFADEHNIVIIDGGTEAGIMKMVGDTRHRLGLNFPLIGVSPLGRVEFPGYHNPNQQAQLEDNHTHFVLVDAGEWGTESPFILQLTHALSGDKPAVGVLINGGKIAMQEVYLASTMTRKLGVIVLEGSGRAADEISTAFRSGKSNQRILRAILAGGDIQLVGTIEGPEVMRTKLAKRFLGDNQ
ncbi:MAG: hypothetical protein CUN56_08460 [Phototrophicales bacterium]|nr:MAG: hypothetical protein CUN56_08460 [Phototrophicales bacterium]RMG76909.1 MAG: hypothetical protein D6711_02815 [Chloroflexota bacterium]